MLIRYISGENNPYRGYQVLIRTVGGNDFTITLTEKEIQRYNSVLKKTHVFILLFLVFPSLFLVLSPGLMERSSSMPALTRCSGLR